MLSPTTAAAIAASGLLLAAGCGHDLAPEPADPPGAPRYVESVHVPDRLGGLQTAMVDANGREVTVSCRTCHDGRDAVSVESADELEQFHVGLRFEHGALACLSCHDPDQRDRLRMADGTTMPARGALDLCGQCHGPQRRDYDHGVHGGASGYWDLSRGPRERNHCIDCHEPHAPAYPAYLPMPAPRDRFLDQGEHR